MKKAFLFLALFMPGITTYVNAQGNEYWIPEAFLKALSRNDTVNIIRFTFPIQAIQYPFGKGKCYVLTYDSELRPNRTVSITHSKVKKVLLTDISNNINLAANPLAAGYQIDDPIYPMRAIAHKLDNSTVTLTEVDSGRILLEILYGSEKQGTFFVNTVNGKKITSYEQFCEVIYHRVIK